MPSKQNTFLTFYQNIKNKILLVWQRPKGKKTLLNKVAQSRVIYWEVIMAVQQTEVLDPFIWRAPTKSKQKLAYYWQTIIGKSNIYRYNQEFRLNLLESNTNFDRNDSRQQSYTTDLILIRKIVSYCLGRVVTTISVIININLIYVEVMHRVKIYDTFCPLKTKPILKNFSRVENPCSWECSRENVSKFQKWK